MFYSRKENNVRAGDLLTEKSGRITFLLKSLMFLYQKIQSKLLRVGTSLSSSAMARGNLTSV
jgi:hypothetical protein